MLILSKKQYPYHSELSKLIDSIRKTLKKNDVVIKLFKKFKVSIDELDLIPIRFSELEVSARTEHAVISLNYELLKEIKRIPSYIVHEITHWLQQTTGDQPTQGSDDQDYLDNVFEIEGFQNQTEFISDTEGDLKAKEYTKKVLDHHNTPKNEIKEKEKDLLRLARFNKLKLLKKLASMTVDNAKIILDLNDGFTEEDIKKSYKRKASILHPDVNKNAQIKFVELVAAKDKLLSFLTNPTKDEEQTQFDDATFNQRPWTKQYYEPLSNYDDLEKWEYYTNPEIQKQYEQEFADEQVYGQEDYEQNEEQKWELQRDNFYDLVSNLEDKIRELNLAPKFLLEMFATFKRPEELELFTEELKESGKWHKSDPKYYNAAIDEAIIKYIVDYHPDKIKHIYENERLDGALKEISEAGSDVGLREAFKTMSVEDIAYLINNGQLQVRDIKGRPAEEHLKLFTMCIDAILKSIYDPKANIPDLLWRTDKEALRYLRGILMVEPDSKVKTNVIFFLDKEIDAKRANYNFDLLKQAGLLKYPETLYSEMSKWLEEALYFVVEGGLPGYNIKSKDYDYHGRDFKTKEREQPHTLRDIEFYTDLSDAVYSIKKLLTKFPKIIWKKIISSIVNAQLTSLYDDEQEVLKFKNTFDERYTAHQIDSMIDQDIKNSYAFRFFKELKINAPYKYKKAVKEFYKAIQSEFDIEKSASQQFEFKFKKDKQQISRSELLEEIKEFMNDYENNISKITNKSPRHIKKEKLHPLEQKYRLEQLKKLMSNLPKED